MNILITGGAGFIGSSLVRRFIHAEGHKVLNLDKITYAANLSNLSDVSASSKYQFLQADICDGDLLKKVFVSFAPDAVMHLAAESHVDRSIDHPEDFITTNIIGSYRLLEAALEYYENLPSSRRQDFRFIHISTDEVFGSLRKDANAFARETPYDPRSPYSASKAASDHLARAWQHTYGLPVIITNCSNNYGPYQFPEKFIPLIITNCLRDNFIPVYGTGSNVRDWLYVEDHCQALEMVLEKGTVGSTYIIGGNAEHTNMEIATTVCEILDDLVPRFDDKPYADLIKLVEDRPGHDFRYAVDITTTTTEIGWAPSTSFDVGIKKTVEWYIHHQDWWKRILNREH